MQLAKEEITLKGDKHKITATRCTHSAINWGCGVARWSRAGWLPGAEVGFLPNRVDATLWRDVWRNFIGRGFFFGEPLRRVVVSPF